MRDENDWIELLRDRDTRIADLEQYEARNHELAEQLADMTAQLLDADRRVRELIRRRDRDGERFAELVAISEKWRAHLQTAVHCDGDSVDYPMEFLIHRAEEHVECVQRLEPERDAANALCSRHGEQWALVHRQMGKHRGDGTIADAAGRMTTRIAELETLLSDVTTRWRDTVVELCELVDADDVGIEDARI